MNKHPQHGIFISSALVALLAVPSPLKMVETIINRDMFQNETEVRELKLEQKTPVEKLHPTPIHPLNFDPKRLLGDQFVQSLNRVEQRATQINAIF